MADGPAGSAGDPGKRGGPPRWMLVGFGCMAVIGFIIVALAAWTMAYMGRLGNKSEAWKELGDLIAFDDSARGTPTGLEDDPNTAADESHTPGEFELLMGGESFASGGLEAYWFGRDVSAQQGTEVVTGPNPLFVAIVKLKAEQTAEAMTARVGLPFHEPKTFEIQGLEFDGNVLPEMVVDRPTQGLTRSEEVHGAGAVILLRDDFEDPEHEDELFDLLAFFQRPASSEPIHDEEIVRFFGPFDLAGLATFGQGEDEADGAVPAVGERPATPPVPGGR